MSERDELEIGTLKGMLQSTLEQAFEMADAEDFTMAREELTNAATQLGELAAACGVPEVSNTEQTERTGKVIDV